MKQISRLLLLSIFLTSCANALPLAPAFTETTAPTGTLAITDTPQPTPTATPDPNMPEGATGKDIEENYMKTV